MNDRINTDLPGDRAPADRQPITELRQPNFPIDTFNNLAQLANDEVMLSVDGGETWLGCRVSSMSELDPHRNRSNPEDIDEKGMDWGWMKRMSLRLDNSSSEIIITGQAGLTVLKGLGDGQVTWGDAVVIEGGDKSEIPTAVAEIPNLAILKWEDVQVRTLSEEEDASRRSLDISTSIRSGIHCVTNIPEDDPLI